MAKLARISTDDGVRTGRYEDGAVTTDDGDRYEESEYDLLAPCEPTACYCVGRNFGEKVDQMGYDTPDEPDFFIKPPVSVLAPGAPIEYPTFTEEFTYAGELTAVIGEECHELDESEVDDVLLGYTVMNDLDCLDQVGRTARKAFDGSAPLGPYVETDVDVSDMAMETYVAGEKRQEASTTQMFFTPQELVAHLSQRFTFKPGDVVSFGSPANPGLLEPGDEVEITYEGVGTLRNTVVE